MKAVFWTVLVLFLGSLLSSAAVSTHNNISFTNDSPIGESDVLMTSSIIAPSPNPVVSSAARISSPLMVMSVIGIGFSMMGFIGETLKPERQIEQMAPEKQAKVDMTTEMMSDAIDDAIGDDEAEEETDELTNQVLNEIGVDVASHVGS